MVFPRPIAAVVFDMDGLLIDSETLYRDALLAAAAEIGKPLPVSIFHTLIGAPITQNRETLLGFFGADYDVEALFVAASHRREKVHKYGHMHLDDFLARRDQFRNEVIIASHFSTRYTDDRIRRILAKRLPDMLDGRLHLWL